MHCHISHAIQETISVRTLCATWDFSIDSYVFLGNCEILNFDIQSELASAILLTGPVVVYIKRYAYLCKQP